jgi:hypothetical protein
MKYALMIGSLLILLAGCSGSSEPGQKENEIKAEASTAEEQPTLNIRNMEITKEDNVVQIAGEARATDDLFYYQLEQDGEFLTDETEIKLDKTSQGWGKFEIKLVAEDINEDENPILTLYVKSNSGEVVNPNYIAVDYPD